jgi:hypothetical protein
MKLARGICPQCGRTIALNGYNSLWDHNPNPSGDGALFKGKRAIGSSPTYGTLCSGSGKRPADWV